MENYGDTHLMKKDIIINIIQGMTVTAIFLATEIVLNILGDFNGDIQFYLLEIPLRLIFGTIALMLLKYNFNTSKSQDRLKKLFTNAIPKCTYVLLLPFIMCLVLTLLPMIFGEAKEISTGFVGIYGLNCGQQFATGYFEEATRALLMCGLLKYYTDTKKKRVQTIVIAGICFALSHALNFFFGQNIVATFSQVFHAFMWGLFAASIYMLSKNLTLLMVMHTVWDIVVKVPNTFFNFTDSNVFIDVAQMMRVILAYGIMPLVAVYICINYEKLIRNQLIIST